MLLPNRFSRVTLVQLTRALDSRYWMVGFEDGEAREGRLAQFLCLNSFL